METLADALPVERTASRWIVRSDPAEMVERIGRYVELGFNHLVFHAPGPTRRASSELFGARVLPLLRSRFG